MITITASKCTIIFINKSSILCDREIEVLETHYRNNLDNFNPIKPEFRESLFENVDYDVETEEEDNEFFHANINNIK